MAPFLYLSPPPEAFVAGFVTAVAIGLAWIWRTTFRVSGAHYVCERCGADNCIVRAGLWWGRQGEVVEGWCRLCHGRNMVALTMPTSVRFVFPGMWLQVDEHEQAEHEQAEHDQAEHDQLEYR